jgi:CheY-like chemotaxis protein/DNA-directed RNA polymerase subunit RPC12/RpoP
MAQGRKMAAACPQCNERYLVECAKIPPGGGFFTCRICGEKIDIQDEGEISPSAVTRLSGEDEEPGCPQCGHRAAPKKPATSEVRPPVPEDERKTVLVVEDTEFFRELALDVLGQRYRTLEAKTVEEAVDILRHEEIDLLVLDLALDKDCDGLSILRAMPGQRFPVLIYTSGQHAELFGAGWEKLRLAGADDVLIKGMNVEEQMLEKVESLLASRPAV